MREENETLESEKNEDKSSVGLNILSFCVPIVGVVLYFVYMSSSPKKARGCLVSGIVSFVLGWVLSDILEDLFSI
jgi:hypothetical protein